MFKDLVQGKKIAIIGNALSLQSQKKGNEIDNHNLVVRINIPGNLFYDNMKNVYGTKMDIWCCWKADVFLDKNEEKYVHCFKNSDDIYKIEVLASTETIVNVETLYTDNRIKNLEKLIIELYPPRFKRTFYKFSTGFLLLNYLAICNPQSVSIYGFDFKKTGTFYEKNPNRNMINGLDTICGHDFRIEEKYISDHFLKTNKNFKVMI